MAAKISIGAAAAAVAIVASMVMMRAVGLDNGAGRLPPLGWSTWCSGGKCGNDYCDETMVLGAADAMVANGMAKLGWNYVVLDDCFVSGRDKNGTFLVDENRFPHGMKFVADTLHGLGMKFGLYTSVGNVTCNNHGEGHPTPGSEGFYQQDMDLFASWGVDYVKADACGDVKKEWHKGPGAYLAVSKAVTHTTPNRTMFLECVGGYPFLLVEVPHYCNSWRVASDHHDNWKSTESTIAMQNHLDISSEPGAWSAMDILTTGGEGCTNGTAFEHCPKQTDIEYQTEFTMWAFTQSPMLVATDVRNMTGIMSKALLNSEIIAMHQDTRTKAGKRIATWLCSEPLMCSVWGREIANDDDNSSSSSKYAIVLYNAGSKSHSITAEFGHFGWSSDVVANVRNVWEQRDEGKSDKGKYTAEVPAHGVVYVVLSKE